MILDKLCDLDESPWAALGKPPRPLDARGIARLLRDYGISAKTVRVGEAAPPGYQVAVRRLHHASQPERHILAATRPAISDTAPVQAMITALQAEANAQRHASTQPRPAAH